MRGMLLIAGGALLILAIFGVLAMPDDEGGEGTGVDAPAGTATPALTTPANGTVTTQSTQPAIPGGPTPTPGGPGVQNTPGPNSPIVTVTTVNGVPIPDVQPPQAISPSEGLARVRDYYSEEHRIGNYNIRWRPGAFPAERATQVAAMAEESHAYVMQQLNYPQDTAPIDIFLVDELFNDECRGCQGFAAADLRQVFILQDGSVEEAEFKSLLTHEIGHVIALNIALPEKLFFAEGLAVWLMERDWLAGGYISAKQTSAWALELGMLPTLDTLREATYQGRVRSRLEYDPAGSFAMFMLERYGLDTYKELYALRAPEDVLDRSWGELESEWHEWLRPQAQATVEGVTGAQFWASLRVVMDGFTRLYENPAAVTKEQYAYLTAARLQVNRLDLANADGLMALSGLAQ